MRPYRGLTKNGVWVEGWYKEDTYGKPKILAENPEDHFLHWFFVIPESVGQSTDLKDKNGKDSYAGDKIKDVHSDIGIIYWKANIAGFYVKWGDGSDIPINTGVAIDKCEIISNIHEESS